MQVGKLNWYNLVHFKCPKCSTDLEPLILDDGYVCRRCNFGISKEKLEDIVGKYTKVNRPYKKEESDEDYLRNSSLREPRGDSK